MQKNSCYGAAIPPIPEGLSCGLCMKTILVIEDDATVLEYYETLLCENGYKVYTATNGRKALNHILTTKFDVVILDMSLPEINGRSLLLNIKRTSRQLPIIISSGRVGMKDDPEVKMSEQVKEFLLKPVLGKNLLHTVHQVIQENFHKNLEGRRFANCFLEHFLESGSSGAVYKARKDEGIVAVKILAMRENNNVGPPNEATILCSLKHPNIISVENMGIEEDLSYVVMEYFEGESLNKIVQKQGLIALFEAISIISQVAKGMLASHAHNLIHRDLKPSNILYNRKENIAKIIDFGIAQYINSQTYEVVGSPYYMSPEQCQGDCLSISTDIYSLGVTFYHIITGVVPYNGSDAMHTMLAHIQAPLTWPVKTAQKIPIEVRKIIEKMMAKNQDERYKSMSDCILDLEKLEHMIQEGQYVFRK